MLKFSRVLLYLLAVSLYTMSSTLCSLSPQLVFPFKRSIYTFNSYNNVQNPQKMKVIGYVLSKSKETVALGIPLSKSYDSRKDVLIIRVYDIHDVYVGDEVFILQGNYQKIDITHSLIVSTAKITSITKEHSGVYIVQLKGFFSMVARFNIIAIPLTLENRVKAFLSYKDAESFVSREDISSAITNFYQSLEAYPQQVESHLGLSEIYDKRELHKQSKSHIQSAWKYRHRVRDSKKTYSLMELFITSAIIENREYLEKNSEITLLRVLELLKQYKEIDNMLLLLQEDVILSGDLNNWTFSFLKINFLLTQYYIQLYDFFKKNNFQKSRIIYFFSENHFNLDNLRLYIIPKYKTNLIINQKTLKTRPMLDYLVVNAKISLLWEESFFQAASSQLQNLLTYKDNPDYLNILYTLIELLEKYLSSHSEIYSLSQKPLFDLRKKYMQEYLDNTSILDARRHIVSNLLLDLQD